MKDPSASFASEVDRTGLANKAIPVVHSAFHLSKKLLVDGHVVLTRPRLGALLSCPGEHTLRAIRARGRRQSSSLGPSALDIVGPRNERSRAYVTGNR